MHIAGERFSRWTLLRPVEDSRGRGYWLMRCDCGTERAVLLCNVVNMRSTSCGCRSRDPLDERKLNPVWPSEYEAWHGIKRRCYGRNTKVFARYGGRGISVCQRWLDSFDAFLADMGPKPSPWHSIDRINNDGNYEPGNCRWATSTEQNRNRSNNLILTNNGESMPLSQWAERIGLPVSALAKRIDSGIPVDVALSVPSAGIRRLISFRGKTQSIREWAKELKMPENRLACRLGRDGWTVEESLTIPWAPRGTKGRPRQLASAPIPFYDRGASSAAASGRSLARRRKVVDRGCESPPQDNKPRD